MKICLILIATGKYHVFVRDIVNSAKQFLLKEHSLSFHLFTDCPDFEETESFHVTYVPHVPWPAPTLMRYHFITHERAHLANFDYLFYCDVDMRFVSDVGDDILSDFVAVRHPNHTDGGAEKSLDNNPNSTAYVPFSIAVNHVYVAGGFVGGKAENFLNMAMAISSCVDVDLRNKVFARWFDESHLNKHTISNPPTKLLDPNYCWPENWTDCKFGQVKLLALLKNHKEMRG